MSGAAFACKGASTGIAPVTSFFGPIPDKYNVLLVGRQSWTGTQVGNSLLLNSNNPANNVNQWHAADLADFSSGSGPTISLGSMTTAPDGTNTAQKIVESTTNSPHQMNAIYFASPGGHYHMRLAVFLKASDRTRALLKIQGDTSVYAGSFKALFDLAAGVVVSTTAGGSWPTTGSYSGANIIPFGNGWYLCTVDATPSGGTILGYVMIDSGSGNAAENSSYTGNGTAGVYTWRSTMLPPFCFGMSGQPEFFEDFINLNNFDLNDARNDPTKNVYSHSQWPMFYGAPPIHNAGSTNPPTWTLAAPSIVQWNTHSPASQINTLTAAWLGADLFYFNDGTNKEQWTAAQSFNLGDLTVFAGNPPANAPPAVRFADQFGTHQVYQSLIANNVGNQPDTSPTAWAMYPDSQGCRPGVPGHIGKVMYLAGGIMEWNHKIPVPINSPYHQSAFWCYALPGLEVVQNVSDDPYNHGYPNEYFELDFTEMTGYLPASTWIHGENGADLLEEWNAVASCTCGYPVWRSDTTWQFNQNIQFNGVVYNSLQANNLNHQPDISPTWWDSTNIATTLLAQGIVVGTNAHYAFDLSNFNTFSFLFSPADRSKGMNGQGILFFNGRCTFSPSGGPTLHLAFGPIRVSDNAGNPDTNQNTMAWKFQQRQFLLSFGGGQGVQADFVKVTK